MNKPVIAVNKLSHWFGSGEARFQAISDISLQIERGKLTVLMGPSGSGKTTLLTLMSCLRDVHDGSVQLLGHELLNMPEPQQVLLRRRLGFIFQAHNLHESLTALQNVRMGLEVHGPDRNSQYDKASFHILEMLGLGDRVEHIPANLSGGQKQRVAIARALVSNPEIVFADEPTAALDEDSGMQVVKLLKRLGKERETTTVMVTHDNRILEMADRIVYLIDGKISDKNS
jgi:putative ABC transport system ATP-binding protein